MHPEWDRALQSHLDGLVEECDDEKEHAQRVSAALSFLLAASSPFVFSSLASTPNPRLASIPLDKDCDEDDGGAESEAHVHYLAHCYTRRGAYLVRALAVLPRVAAASSDATRALLVDASSMMSCPGLPATLQFARLFHPHAMTLLYHPSAADILMALASLLVAPPPPLLAPLVSPAAWTVVWIAATVDRHVSTHALSLHPASASTEEAAGAGAGAGAGGRGRGRAMGKEGEMLWVVGDLMPFARRGMPMLVVLSTPLSSDPVSLTRSYSDTCCNDTRNFNDADSYNAHSQGGGLRDGAGGNEDRDGGVRRTRRKDAEAADECCMVCIHGPGDLFPVFLSSPSLALSLVLDPLHHSSSTQSQPQHRRQTKRERESLEEVLEAELERVGASLVVHSERHVLDAETQGVVRVLRGGGTASRVLLRALFAVAFANAHRELRRSVMRLPHSRWGITVIHHHDPTSSFSSATTATTVICACACASISTPAATTSTSSAKSRGNGSSFSLDGMERKRWIEDRFATAVDLVVAHFHASDQFVF
eukprot:ANDGO_07916.mRNA.1 hypothetical protein